ARTGRPYTPRSTRSFSCGRGSDAHHVDNLRNAIGDGVDAEPVGAGTGSRRDRSAERRLLEFGEGQLVGNLSKDLGEGNSQRTADRGEQFGGSLLLAAFDL